MSQRWQATGPFLLERLEPLPGTGKPSAIDKRAAQGSVWLGRDGLKGDRVADRRYHGGPDRSVCHFPAQHYARLARQFSALAGCAVPAFGENLSTRDLDERAVCIGDRLRWGAAVIEISQPRVPCVNLDRRHQAPGLARTMTQAGLTGWLYRTVQEGAVEPGDDLELIERPLPRMTVASVWRAYGDEEASLDTLADLAQAALLARQLRQVFVQRLESARNRRDQTRLFD
ncbi:MOSC domain-containing protein [Stutzerimonas nosocomialis]|uniref:MOSC domain-containing protein n=1 Tax=Stutzerimonas nosocomialis TaxID=1056496 RepID=UPI001109FFE2|nr:MOSC domain-containing protein [Stutzerimonas nosocomialis]TLX53112.1 MOSC domain-containing protein [Stutzerimonas nosocomialis]TLX57068.1 MOSC domain-containing protein [Stutzerimonas nosocomialis]